MFNIHLITTIVLFQTLDLDKQKKRADLLSTRIKS